MWRQFPLSCLLIVIVSLFIVGLLFVYRPDHMIVVLHLLFLFSETLLAGLSLLSFILKLSLNFELVVLHDPLKVKWWVRNFG